MYVVITSTSAVACGGLVSPHITFLPGLDSTHLESRSSSESAPETEMPALARPEILTALAAEVAFVVTSV